MKQKNTVATYSTRRAPKVQFVYKNEVTPQTHHDSDVDSFSLQDITTYCSWLSMPDFPVEYTKTASTTLAT